MSGVRQSVLDQWQSDRVRGLYEVFEGEGIRLVRSGAGEVNKPLHRLIRPFEALPLIATGAAEQFLLTDRELAACCGLPLRPQVREHSLQSALFRFGIDPDAFNKWSNSLCTQEPYHLTSEKAALAARAGLAVFLHKEWSEAEKPDHPASKMIQTGLAFWDQNDPSSSLLQISGMYRSLSHPDSLLSFPWRRGLVRLAAVMETFCTSRLENGWRLFADEENGSVALWNPFKKAGGALSGDIKKEDFEALCGSRTNAFDQAAECYN
ncbi:hypothetical protein CR205_01900 [Alteribacter lacisalsi]|uniref:Uncharacterized protein n=1 Tax=Alteribacter lacisalsi TaxID=2045244 RepID=A0A2W0HBJ0_9BACI|nr:hypothetical protein [Alteribacter lacisalsi]PYZ97380.1 hypothetical protein CR205_01900 [Alteribacter lacisalsi]